MPPKLTDVTEHRISIDSKHTLLIREVLPKTRSDFVVTSSGGPRRDQAIISKNPNASIAESTFYAGKAFISSVAPGAELYIQSSADQPAVIVQLEKA